MKNFTSGMIVGLGLALILLGLALILWAWSGYDIGQRCSKILALDQNIAESRQQNERALQGRIDSLMRQNERLRAQVQAQAVSLKAAKTIQEEVRSIQALAKSLQPQETAVKQAASEAKVWVEPAQVPFWQAVKDGMTRLIVRR